MRSVEDDRDATDGGTEEMDGADEDNDDDSEEDDNADDEKDDAFLSPSTSNDTCEGLARCDDMVAS